MLTKDSPEFVLSKISNGLDEFTAWCQQPAKRHAWVRLRITASDDDLKAAADGYHQLRNDPTFNTIRIITILDGDVSFSALLIWLSSHGRRITPHTSVTFHSDARRSDGTLGVVANILASHIIFTRQDETTFGGNLGYRWFTTATLLNSPFVRYTQDIRHYFSALVEEL